MKPSDFEAMLRTTFEQHKIDASPYTDLYLYVIRPLVSMYEQLYTKKNMVADSLLNRLITPGGFAQTVAELLGFVHSDYIFGTLELVYDPLRLGNTAVTYLRGLFFEYNGKLFTVDEVLLTDSNNKAYATFRSVIKLTADDVEKMKGSKVKIEGDQSDIIVDATVMSVTVPVRPEITEEDVASTLHAAKFPTTASVQRFLTEVLGTKVTVVPYYELPNYHGIE